MLDVRRRWLRRFGTAASVALLLYALYHTLPSNQSCPQPQHPKPGAGYACDPSGPSFHHPALWLVVAAASLLALVAVRRLLSDGEA